MISVHCPFCHAPITVGRASASKKVRCPKCRKLIIPDASGEEAKSRSSVEESDTLRPSPSEPRPATSRILEAVTGDTVPEANGRSPEHLQETQADYLDGIQMERLMRHLRCGKEDRQITIRVTDSNPEALPFARFLNELFNEAGWRTTEIIPIEPGMRHGESVTLHAGPWPFPKEVTMTCMALTSAGVDFTSLMNPRQIRERVVLVISGKPNFTRTQ